jgi:hypothetical protein
MDGYYTYNAAFFLEENSKTWHVQMGCFTRALSEWKSNFWNNNNEFPNNGSEKSNKRLKTFNLIEKFIEIENISVNK